jgi:hypothetical protein
MRFLVLTVGGSHQPILRSIEQNKPDFVHFLCSSDIGRTKGSYYEITGPGKVLKSSRDLPRPDLPNVVTLAGLRADHFQVSIIEHLDSLNECYLSSLDLIERVHRETPDAIIVVDYTGGTKSMTAGLVAAALDDGQCEISLVSGIRQNLHQVTKRTEFVRPVQVWDAQSSRRFRAAADLIARFDYSGASEVLQEASRRFASEASIEKLQRWMAFCRAFDAWDKFDHTTAKELLQPFPGRFNEYKMFLGPLLTKTGHGFEMVEDLLRNAERRAAQERFDDAVGRLYRTLELTSQIWLLKHHKIDTSNVELERIPESMRERVARETDVNGRTRIGLLLAWDVIAAMPDNALSRDFSAARSKLLGFLNVRNESLFAHGLRPVSKHDYAHHAPIVCRFVETAIESALSVWQLQRKVVLKQLPASWA